jgi:acyl transferase domain-containing protein
VACRVPGAEDPESLWRNLCDGVDSIGGHGFGRLAALEDFDAAAFGMTAGEAALMDPQHRIFLEVARWALDDVGCDPAGTDAQIGVFAGCGANRYQRYHLLGNPEVLPADAAAGEWDELLATGSADYMPARVAYALGLTGPAVAVQTACSSSLVAVCQAAQSLLDYRCDLALAGGAAVVSTRQIGGTGATHAADGVCRPFDVSATGQVFGNGGAAVALKRLADAIEDGDHIYAVLSGWAVNNDGAARAGFTTPAVSGQAAVVAEALACADWDPADIGFVEGHGSGTPIGDAMEIEALSRAFASVSDQAVSGAAIGSVKGNLGNLDAAAGVVGLVKTVLAVREGVIPPTLHFTGLHPDVELSGAKFTVVTEPTQWPTPRRAGVSSFGLGGTNAHVLVEQAPGRSCTRREVPARTVFHRTRCWIEEWR